MRWFLLPLLLLPGCAFMDAPTGPAASDLPYSLAVRDSLAFLNAHRVAYRSSDVIGKCVNPDTVVMWLGETRMTVVSFRACS